MFEDTLLRRKKYKKKYCQCCLSYAVSCCEEFYFIYFFWGGGGEDVIRRHITATNEFHFFSLFLRVINRRRRPGLLSASAGQVERDRSITHRGQFKERGGTAYKVDNERRSARSEN